MYLKMLFKELRKLLLRKNMNILEFLLTAGDAKAFPINLILTKRLMMKIKFLSLTMLKF